MPALLCLIPSLSVSHAIALLSLHPASLSSPLPFSCQSLHVSPPVSASLLIWLRFSLQSKAFLSPSLFLSCFCLSSSTCSSSSFSVPPLPYHPTHLGQRIVLGRGESDPAALAGRLEDERAGQVDKRLLQRSGQGRARSKPRESYVWRRGQF